MKSDFSLRTEITEDQQLTKFDHSVKCQQMVHFYTVNKFKKYLYINYQPTMQQVVVKQKRLMIQNTEYKRETNDWVAMNETTRHT